MPAQDAVYADGTFKLNALGKTTKSADVGIDAPDAPPNVADHLAVEFQSPELTRYRFAIKQPR
jgi:hypothetical protein